jgi:hypothetical protein
LQTPLFEYQSTPALPPGGSADCLTQILSN